MSFDEVALNLLPATENIIDTLKTKNEPGEWGRQTDDLEVEVSQQSDFK